MKTKRLITSKREFFTKAGLGILSAVAVSKIPFSRSFSGKGNSQPNNSIKIKINPLAVKRKNKDS
jgi:hypothetical protein